MLWNEFADAGLFGDEPSFDENDTAIDIGYLKDRNYHEVTLVFRDTYALEKFYYDPRLIDLDTKEGEELVSAIMTMVRPGDIQFISRATNGKASDGPNGEPAQVHYYEDGKLQDSAHYQNGRMTDVNGDAGLKLYDQLGQLSHEDHYKDGVRTEGHDVPTKVPTPPNKKYRPSM